ncbi:hypothetical protein QVG61_07825 [Thiohalobacter sp. IOR34]|uniref:hypothetical protein n=1 Tax=Thiohalobacter sp. IOR34 TaxID=3057176 RepID=UPI0025AEF966|nr:hypothetical protein [Thiohalobacter sp. IOR34]WJW74426.1 hypothetical protein QVG61_07825 [Thiohalobacter sp. IOR34]
MTEQGRGASLIKRGLLLTVFLAPALLQAGDPPIAVGEREAQPFQRYLEDYERCQARREFKPVRGEYETREEYRRRVERLRAGCDGRERLEPARFKAPVFLSYDADAQRFSFELPQARTYRIRYDALVWDDFPKLLVKLPRDKWHVDDPTPRASVYKECRLRRVSFDPAYFSRVEPYRADSWRGCMTYYQRGDDFGWHREEGVFSIEDVTFHAYIPVDKARRLKRRERDLYYLVSGSLRVPERRFDAEHVELRDVRTGEVLITLEP